MDAFEAEQMGAPAFSRQRARPSRIREQSQRRHRQRRGAGPVAAQRRQFLDTPAIAPAFCNEPYALARDLAARCAALRATKQGLHREMGAYIFATVRNSFWGFSQGNPYQQI